MLVKKKNQLFHKIKPLSCCFSRKLQGALKSSVLLNQFINASRDKSGEMSSTVRVENKAKHKNMRCLCVNEHSPALHSEPIIRSQPVQFNNHTKTSQFYFNLLCIPNVCKKNLNQF